MLLPSTPGRYLCSPLQGPLGSSSQWPLAAFSPWFGVHPSLMPLSALPQVGSDSTPAFWLPILGVQFALNNSGSHPLDFQRPPLFTCNPTLQGSLQSGPAAFPAQPSPSNLHGTFSHGPTFCLTSTRTWLPGPAHLTAAWSGFPLRSNRSLLSPILS